MLLNIINGVSRDLRLATRTPPLLRIRQPKVKIRRLIMVEKVAKTPALNGEVLHYEG